MEQLDEEPILDPAPAIRCGFRAKLVRERANSCASTCRTVKHPYGTAPFEKPARCTS
jgi:hypothetical protein